MSVGPKIVLVVSGGIAAYRTLDLARMLRREGAQVQVVMTKAARKFVSPLSFAALTNSPVHTDFCKDGEQTSMEHIHLSRQADLILVCPATADILANMAGGFAPDLACSLLLASDKPVVVAPSMNVQMWHHPATQRNLQQLAADGVHILRPDTGEMACGEEGTGRLLDISEIVRLVLEIYRDTYCVQDQGIPVSHAHSLDGVRALVSAGPTQEALDPVRYIANRSSGKQGFAIAAALAEMGAHVQLVAGPVDLPTPRNVVRTNVTTACEMARAVESSLPVDIAVMAAAVTDWRVDTQAEKIKKSAPEAPVLILKENPDILHMVATHKSRPRLVIGFAAETENIVENAQIKLCRKNADWVIANDVSQGVFGADDNTIYFLRKGHVEAWNKMEKRLVAQKLAHRIGQEIGHITMDTV